MRNPDVIIIGGGQAGLAMSRSLTARGVDHLVLERGRIGERWYSQRWHSLHLLTTAAMSALPGLRHNCDPEAFMHANAFAAYLTSYVDKMSVPIISGVEVTGVEPACGGYRVRTTHREWRANAVVVATGACDTPFRPPMAQALTPSIIQVYSADYQSPTQLPNGGVLVVGASASGAQLAEEIHTSGRRVTLAVGNHTPAPRRYRGRDIYECLELAGILDEPPPAGIDLARRQPSLQVVGRADHRDLNLKILDDQGIRLLGRLADINGVKVQFKGDLRSTVEAAQARMLRTLDRIDRSLNDRGLEAPAADPGVRTPFVADSEVSTLDLKREGIRSIVWATGYVRRYPWLKVPVLDARGEIIQRGGVTTSPGFYTLGLNYMRRRRSAFIDGCGYDAEDLAPMVVAHLDRVSRQVA
jgi:putative flavoprotein involved in K+ transport